MRLNEELLNEGVWVTLNQIQIALNSLGTHTFNRSPTMIYSARPNKCEAFCFCSFMCPLDTNARLSLIIVLFVNKSIPIQFAQKYRKINCEMYCCWLFICLNFIQPNKNSFIFIWWITSTLHFAIKISVIGMPLRKWRSTGAYQHLNDQCDGINSAMKIFLNTFRRFSWERIRIKSTP